MGKGRLMIYTCSYKYRDIFNESHARGDILHLGSRKELWHSGQHKTAHTYLGIPLKDRIVGCSCTNYTIRRSFCR